ncbi:hypothetical protein [Chondrinema litorale]|uniref:hypothetical protein n=1 Tax=Chondrinema litorale TaxID=2994555 RepID=UPI002543D2FD|nr:hypothetical protein [Chondrinema litorale]UZR98224.1 hypothetical protein OQ292_29945 [Chondrinema litorale]
MDYVFNFFIWLLVDVFGIKTIRRENNIYTKILKAIAFLIFGFICVAFVLTLIAGTR